MNVTFGVDPLLIIQLVVSTVLPLLVGLVTTRLTPSSRQALLLAGLAILSSGLTELGESIAAGTAFDFGVWLVGAVGSFVVAVAVHYGYWKPTGVTDKALAAGRTDTDAV